MSLYTEAIASCDQYRDDPIRYKEEVIDALRQALFKADAEIARLKAKCEP